MSKIEKELTKATGLEQEKGEKRPEWLARLLKATGKLADNAWEALSEKAQDWYNANADARNKAKKADEEIPDCTEFPDAEQEEERSSRRRTSDDDEAPARGKGKEEKPSVEKLEEGQRVKITTKRGAEYTGKVVENNAKKEYVVVADEESGKEKEVDYDKVDALEVFHGDAGKEEKGGGDAEPAVGDEVEITTKRGKTIKCTILELTDDEIVFEDKEGKDDIGRDRVESIKVLKKGKAAAKEEPKSKGKDDGDKGSSKGKDEGEKTRSKNEPGVSVGQVITELICDDMKASEEDIGKLLKKKSIECKENTLHLNYVATHKVLAVLKEKKLLKA